MGRKAKVRASTKAAKKAKAVHPESRKAKQMNKKYLRKAKLSDQKRTLNFKQFKKGVDILWFRQQLSKDTKRLTKDQLKELTQRYVQRFDEEIQELEATKKAKHRHMMLSEKANHEQSLLKSGHGIEVPDLTDPENVRRLLEWHGELKSIPAIKHTTVSK